MEMHGTELISFKIISAVGTARSYYIDAIQKAKSSLWDEAQNLIQQGDKAFAEGHQAHMCLLTQEAGTPQSAVDLLLVHAEDQLMSAESFKILAGEFIALYKRIEK
jgi:cellobiose PTS system EIIA component